VLAAGQKKNNFVDARAQALLAGSLTALAPERSLLPCVPVALPSLVT